MASHKRNSPGIEINEIDRSQYNKIQDYSLVDTTTLICGFANKGENYTTKWINTKKTFENEYGFPTNEVERYFYNGALEILKNGGTLITSKLPYDNDSKDNFAFTELTIDFENILLNNEFEIQKNDLLSIDNSIKSCFKINYNFQHNESNDLIDLDTLDNYKTSGFKELNKIRIIDITQKQYETIDLLSVYEDTANNKNNVIADNSEFLGIMPVIVSPINALYFQKIIQDEISTYQRAELSNETTDVNSGQQYSPNINQYNPITNAKNRYNYNLSDYFTDNMANNFALPLCANLITDETVSKIATSYFPTITFNENNKLNKKYLKQIGVVVFSVIKDSISQEKLNFIPVESFVGSLDRNEIDPITKKNIFIDNIINNQSNYINFFSNININAYKQFDTFLVLNQTASILGYKKDECDKIIDYSESILKPLSRIFDILQDPNYVNIDIVCDAGVSNIAQYVSKNNNEINIENYPFYNDSKFWTLNSFDDSKAWKTVLQKFDLFCKKQRQDCIFIADGLRPFCLDGNEKIVRKTNIKNTIDNSIIPKLKYMTGINSSYSAGYCDWFYIQDAYTGDFFWCPPSIKAAGIYTNNDIYFNKWDAPAGIIRGKVLNVIDTAFSPKNDEAGKIYLYSWNYAVNYPLDGIVLEGQKTFQIEATALDRINVRRLLLYLKKNVNAIARRFVYEGNTEYIRQRFVDTIRPIFENAKNGYGLTDYVIRCDDILNTPEVIDRNELHCKIAIKPVKTIEWIICDFIVTNQSANVNEEVVNT